MGRLESFVGEKEKLSLDVTILGGCCNHQAVVAVSVLAASGHIFLCDAQVWEGAARGLFSSFFALF